MENQPEQYLISMPLNYWELNKNFWGITDEMLLAAQKREDGIIAKKGSDILAIGNKSNGKWTPN